MAFGPDVPPIQAHICVEGGDNAIAFYEKAFGAKATFVQHTDDGRIMHANLALFGGEVMLHDSFPEHEGDVSALTDGRKPGLAISINLKAPADVDAAVSRAAEAGATVTMRPDDMFWGARYGRVRDPYGHVWSFNAPMPGQPQLGAADAV